MVISVAASPETTSPLTDDLLESELLSREDPGLEDVSNPRLQNPINLGIPLVPRLEDPLLSPLENPLLPPLEDASVPTTVLISSSSIPTVPVMLLGTGCVGHPRGGLRRKNGCGGGRARYLRTASSIGKAD